MTDRLLGLALVGAGRIGAYHAAIIARHVPGAGWSPWPIRAREAPSAWPAAWAPTPSSPTSCSPTRRRGGA